MLRSALALLSSLQVGLRIRESIERSVRQAVVIAIAVGILIIAALFGLLAIYQLLLGHGFTAAEAAGILAAAIFLLSMLVLATLPLSAPRRKREAPTMSMATGEGMSMIDQSLGKAMERMGPITMLTMAFVGGILASRRR